MAFVFSILQVCERPRAIALFYGILIFVPPLFFTPFHFLRIPFSLRSNQPLGNAEKYHRFASLINYYCRRSFPAVEHNAARVSPIV